MKSLGASHARHLSDSCMPVAGPQEPICPLTPDPHATYLLNPTISHYGTLDPHMHHFPPASPIALQSDCLLPLNNQLTTSNTFPRFQFPSQVDQTEYTQQGCVSQTASRTGTLTTSASMGMGLGLGLTVPPMISSGTATISSAAAAKMNRIPTGLLDQLEHHVPLQRDGFSTLQFHRRSRGAKQRSESPGRIRNLVHSVQKLFSKTQSVEGSGVKGTVQGADGTKATRRSKSKDRAKTEGAKRRGRPNLSGFWSSDDALEDEATTQEATGPVAVAYRNPLSMMTLGRAVSDSQAPPRTHAQGYNTIAAHRSLKPSKSSGELKTQTVSSTIGPAGDGTLAKRGSWSTLTLSQARQVLQKGTATVNRTLLKSKSYHQELTSNFLQVPVGDWSGTLGKGTGAGGEIPCRRMRSGSYVKAMGDPEDSDQSDSPPSPKPSPKTAARRQSYLKATQQSLSEQQPPLPPRNCLPSLRELTTNRSLDNLDCLVGQSDSQHWDREGNFSHGSSTLGRGSGISQMDQSCLCSAAYGHMDSQAVEALDLTAPTCFRSRSHSYLRAIQAGCSQDDDSDSDEPPLNTSSNMSTRNKTPPPVPPRSASKPFISVTVQSSTESAQDTYLEQRSEANSQSGRSNSSDSATSSRTGSLAKAPLPLIPHIPIPVPLVPPIPVPVPSARVSSPPPPPARETQTVSVGFTQDELRGAARRKLSSIGIQVDCVQPVLREEHTPTTKFQSIGVQVEDGRPLSRFSSMASRQETADAETQDRTDSKALETSCSACSTQTLDSPGSAERAQKSSSTMPESVEAALDPSSLPPPPPSLQSVSVNGASEQPGAPAACLRDGHCFLRLLQAETGRMDAWCQQMEQESKDKQLSEEVLGKIRSAVGSAQLLMSQKFQQFRGLCEQNLDVNAHPRPTAQDLAGFWDLLQLSIEDISMKFDELHLLKANDWKLPESSSKKEERKPVSVTTPKKAPKPKAAGPKEKSSGDSAADKQRQEARKRLMAAKRAASERQNSATESADSIEIYVPEAQTRL
ncbi:disks large-associated protein 4 isoform X1 [Pangasianodon hypophthalmus]|uniref:disks large-associated protein 4 isoform X1 n=1 Tax=Pangasianodon hypophthalmus TaxID=310915 RepID=UPI002307FDD4|nr:disks large-associated protein 4 isoform X1 [Pangasianodon hypophthalmus]XP_053096547.1 disks large-associated protein 4 isoform X1 [Pangasianodon hypophthalmus]